MKKFFGFGKAKDAPQQKPSNSKLAETKAQMDTYKGQSYNPAEDDGITTESMFRVVDGDTGERIDVRELLGLTEEDFKENPDLLQVLQHMNNIKPIERDEDEETKDDGSKSGMGNA